MKKSIPRHNIIKLFKSTDREKTIKAAREKDKLHRNKDKDNISFLFGDDVN